MDKARFPQQAEAVARQFPGAHVVIEARASRDVTKADIIKKVKPTRKIRVQGDFGVVVGGTVCADVGGDFGAGGGERVHADVDDGSGSVGSGF